MGTINTITQELLQVIRVWRLQAQGSKNWRLRVPAAPAA